MEDPVVEDDRSGHLVKVHKCQAGEIDESPAARRIAVQIVVVSRYTAGPSPCTWCSELAALDPDRDLLHAKIMVVIESVTHHMDEEEQDWFPKVGTAWGIRSWKGFEPR
jgi:hypothetical protein